MTTIVGGMDRGASGAALLGAQAVGRGGVDVHISHNAPAIQLGPVDFMRD